MVGFALALVLTGGVLFGAGMWVSAAARTAQTGAVISSVLCLSMMLFAGLWMPRSVMAPVLRTISNYNPDCAAVAAL